MYIACVVLMYHDTCLSTFMNSSITTQPCLLNSILLHFRRSIHLSFHSIEPPSRNRDPKRRKQCFKITQKCLILLKIASEASYVYILSGQKFIKNAKNGQFGDFLKTGSLRSNSVTRQDNFNRAKISRKCDFLGDFQTL